MTGSLLMALHYTDLLAMLLGLAACQGKDTESPVRTPGASESARTQVLDAGAAALQSKPPIEAINSYLDGFHFYNGRQTQQMEAHHYCAILNDDVIQCVIYDGHVKDAKLMGVEYIVSARLFADLPAEEKALWHSHVYEVKSGQRPLGQWRATRRCTQSRCSDEIDVLVIKYQGISRSSFCPVLPEFIASQFRHEPRKFP